MIGKSPIIAQFMSADLSHMKQSIDAGSHDAFKELYLLMYIPLMRFAYVYTHNSHACEDVLSDVFLQLWSRRGSLSNISNLRVYLYTAVKNTAINYRNKQDRINQEADGLLSLESNDPDPANALISLETQRIIQHAVHQLPPRCKLIYQLAREEGLRYKEIASILGISVKTIDNQLAIALERIGKALLAHAGPSFKK